MFRRFRKMKPFMAIYLHAHRWTDRAAGVIFSVFGTRLAMDRQDTTYGLF